MYKIKGMPGMMPPPMLGPGGMPPPGMYPFGPMGMPGMPPGPPGIFPPGMPIYSHFHGGMPPPPPPPPPPGAQQFTMVNYLIYCLKTGLQDSLFF